MNLEYFDLALLIPMLFVWLGFQIYFLAPRTRKRPSVVYARQTYEPASSDQMHQTVTQ